MTTSSFDVIVVGAGISATLTISRPEELEAASRFLTDSPAPRFLWARVMPGPPSDWKRNWHLADCRTRFRDSVLEGSDG